VIPKVIHYIWFGGRPLTQLAERCISSWKEYCPDYEIVRWDESNFDVAQNQYCKEAYEAKKWAFASDYTRLWVLVNEGGIYMDTDVQVIKPLDRFLGEEAFSGFEAEDRLPTGIMAAEKGQRFLGRLLHDYDHRTFTKEDGTYDLTTNVEAITNTCVAGGIQLNNCKQTVEGFTLYPSDYFCPKDPSDLSLHITENTYTIHHFDGSWQSSSERLHRKVAHVIGPKATSIVKKVLGRGHE
jgi:hypothetical protein